jgi:hypothetical protein
MKPAPLIPDPSNVRILTVRDQRVMLDSDLAAIYGTTTAAFNQSVSRNLKRFPADFSFTLTSEELAGLISQSVISKLARGGRTKAPRVFTEHGAIMAATVLHSPEAVSMSVFVVRAFVKMREHILANADVLKRLAEIDKTLLKHDRSLQVTWRPKNHRPGGMTTGMLSRRLRRYTRKSPSTVITGSFGFSSLMRIRHKSARSGWRSAYRRASSASFARWLFMSKASRTRPVSTSCRVSALSLR